MQIYTVRKISKICLELHNAFADFMVTVWRILSLRMFFNKMHVPKETAGDPDHEGHVHAAGFLQSGDHLTHNIKITPPVYSLSGLINKP